MGENARLDDAFVAVVVIVAVLALLGAVVALATSGGAYDDIGHGRLWAEEPRGDTAAEEVAEVRQMLAARSARRIARGEPPLDVEAEVSKRLREV